MATPAEGVFGGLQNHDPAQVIGGAQHGVDNNQIQGMHA
jgi:hypothetical protein